MDNSQSSDVFSDSGGYSFEKHTKMDIVTYEDLVAKTKLLLSTNIKVKLLKSQFTEFFAGILADCGTCVAQGLELVLSLLSEPDVNLAQLCEYLDSTVNVLHLLCGFITRVVECEFMTYCNANVFPTATGRIILAVFTHCKDSDSIYGVRLKAVEHQLKDLFRNCHELQLVYLMVLEKHYVFDLTEYTQMCTLVEALDINLKIGEIVQTLDVKTMAEQWKAYTMVCEKYSDYLKDTHLNEDCTKVLCKMTRNNIQNAVEVDQEDKMVVRSLKVASFTTKILLRIYNTFKLATNKNFDHIMELLLYVYANNPAYLESSGKSAQFLNLMNNNVINPSELLLKELLTDGKFVDCLCKYSFESIARNDNLLGYILIIISAMKIILRTSTIGIKLRIIACIYLWLPYGHIWLNMSLKFKNNSGFTFGLYEHLLTHTFAMASTFDAEEMAHLEHKMYESLLGVECYSALFSSNLWELLARSSPRQYLSSQVLYLCKIYQSLERHHMFPRSPQQTHLSQTIRKLSKILHSEDKVRISKQLRNKDERNTDLWIILKNENSEHSIDTKLKTMFHELFTSEIEDTEKMDTFVKLMKLTATDPLNIASIDANRLGDDVTKCWMKMCPQNNNCFLSLMCLEYVEALAALTTAMSTIFRNSDNLVKVLHVVSSLIEKGDTELQLVLINLLLNLAQHSCRDKNMYIAEKVFIETFKLLLQETDSNVKNTFWTKLWTHKDDPNIDKILAKILITDPLLQENWNKICRSEIEFVHLKDNLSATMDWKYTHKCMKNQTVIELSDSISVNQKTNSNNFDLADLDTLFEVESDSEPACKKAKLESSEPEEIIARLENDVSLLSNVKDKIFSSDCKVRIRVLCEKLVGVIE